MTFEARMKRYVLGEILGEHGAARAVVRVVGATLPANVAPINGCVALDLVTGNVPIPITDLVLDEDGFSATLSFNRVPFHCVVPWGCVIAVSVRNAAGVALVEVTDPAEVPAPKPGLRLVKEEA